VIPAQFDYLRPNSLDEAVRALADAVAAQTEVKVLAGGQSLLPVLRLRLAAPELVVDLGGLAELRGVREDGSEIVVGAMTTHHDVVRDELLREHVGLLSNAAATVADPQVRHRGTLGGALAHADPAGDLGAVALALGASFVIVGPSGRRTVPADEFFVDLFTTALGEDEVLAEIRFPRYTGWRHHYEKFNRTAQAWSMVAVAVALNIQNGVIAEARVGLTNMGSTPIRAAGVEAALVGQPAS
jgi:carbon-monoxide dehydrogenase medium subunit